MPWPEMLVKDMTAGLAKALHPSAPTLLVFPHYPSRGSTIFKIAHALGWQITNRLERSADLAIFWEYGTLRVEYAPLEKLI